MLKETFYLDGVDALSVGIKLQSPIEFSEARPVVNKQSVAGRNGDLIFDEGNFQNRTGKAKCYCLQNDVEKAISSTGRFLMGKRGYRRLETSDDPDHYWMARVENSPKIEMRVRTIAPFEIGFDCKPQRFLKSGENPIIFAENSVLRNSYGQIALPLIKMHGSGSGWLTIGRTTITIKEIDGVLFLDSETQNAYNTNGNQNSSIDAPTFPVLSDGENAIGFGGGIESVEITPRWWEV
jgi:phage-related protein